MFKEKYSLDDLMEIMSILRSPEGCPWDREQTHSSLKKYLLEEAYEVMEVIDYEEKDLLCEELGDLLLQIVYHAKIGEEDGTFTMEDVITGISKKMVSRHTHVFGDDVAETAEDVLTNWEKNKKIEKGMELHAEALHSIPKILPALVRSYKVQKKAAKFGFDWKNIDGALDKVNEEVLEVKEAMELKDKNKLHEEFGDLLFAMVNVARFLDIDPEFALQDATNKFNHRFEKMELKALSDGKTLENMALEEMDQYWEKVKKDERIEKGLSINT